MFSASSGYPGLQRVAAVATGRVTSADGGATSFRLSAGLQQHGRWAKEALPARDPSVQTYFADDDLGSENLRLNARVDRTLGEWGAVSLSSGLSRNQSEFYNFGALPAYGIQLDHYYVRADLFVKDFHLRGYYNANRGNTGPYLQYRERDSTAPSRTTTWWTSRASRSRSRPAR
ncbi:MAG: hypothetical protein R3F59_00220 [Myxococcota bacterium]